MQIVRTHTYTNNKDERKKNPEEFRTNEAVRASFIRLIGEDGAQLGIVPRSDALHRAKTTGLDLVEVSSIGKPPVCKLMDYGKFKYQQKRKSSKAKKNQVIGNIKEIKFRPKTDTHDFHFKIKNLKKFLSKGNKVKIIIIFRGREIVHIDIGREMLKKVLLEVDQHAISDSIAKMEGRQLAIILSPIKKK